jgi:hypothetical protein
MKSWNQTVILLVVFMVLVAGVTFVYQSISSKSPSADGSPQAVASRRPGVRLNLVDYGRRPIEQYEVNTTGHEDFWFDNPNSGPVELGGDVKNSRCSAVEVVVLTPEEKKQLPRWPPAPADGPAHEVALPGHKSWQPLEDGRPVTVPSGGAGAVRLVWENRKPGDERVGVELWAQNPGDPASRSTNALVRYLEVVPPILARSSDALSGELRLRTLDPGTTRLARVLCWSPMRPHFRVQALVEQDAGEQADPFFACTLRPMTANECQGLAAKLSSQTRAKKVASGYVVTVEARERLDEERRMPLGPYRRQLVLRSEDTGGAATIEVRGQVRGDVQVGGDEDHGAVDLGNFAARDGAAKTIVLQTGRADLGLEKESQFPEFLDVALSAAEAMPGGGRRWHLTVKAPGGLDSGALPPGSELVLRTREKVPRLIHIPVRGAGYR